MLGLTLVLLSLCLCLCLCLCISLSLSQCLCHNVSVCLRQAGDWKDWPALWALVRADCDVASVVLARSKTQAEQTETRVRKVETLARAGGKERARAAARSAPPVPVTRDIVQEITSNHISHIFIFQIAEFIRLTLKRMPRLSEPRPLGMRAEHGDTTTSAQESK